MRRGRPKSPAALAKTFDTDGARPSSGAGALLLDPSSPTFRHPSLHDLQERFELDAFQVRRPVVGGDDAESSLQIEPPLVVLVTPGQALEGVRQGFDHLLPSSVCVAGAQQSIEQLFRDHLADAERNPVGGQAKLRESEGHHQLPPSLMQQRTFAELQAPKLASARAPHAQGEPFRKQRTRPGFARTAAQPTKRIQHRERQTANLVEPLPQRILRHMVAYH
mmetsp:Transcript_67660/g.195897  ORF Transcript_67660/g.195897 Transcript_67660/m.195897 type:complete len:221 (-) Transcript_67660:700-1362(-)